MEDASIKLFQAYEKGASAAGKIIIYHFLTRDDNSTSSWDKLLKAFR